MPKNWRRLDNTAKAFSLEEKKNNNTFRLSVILKEKVDSKILEQALVKTLDIYPIFKVKIKTGLFWNCLEYNSNKPSVEEFKGNNVNFNETNNYLFKVTYFNNKINLDILHILTDGVGAIEFLKVIIYNYLNLKYDLKSSSLKMIKNDIFNNDEYLENADKSLSCNEKVKNAFLIKDKYDISNNKAYHYILDLEHLKNICKKHKVSITEYLTAIYIYSIYKTIYDKSSNKDIVVTIPIDLRKHYGVNTLSNFFTCMNICADVSNDKNTSFNKMLNQIHNEFKIKLTKNKIKEYLARDVKLGTNIVIRLTPLFIKKTFMHYMNRFLNHTTTTISNIGPIKIEEQYKKYIDNIIVLVSTGKVQKTKCTICSYENNLNVTLNSNIIDNRLENEFYSLLKKYVGKVKLGKY